MGKGKRDLVVEPRFREYFPNVPDSVQITSPQTPEYNCFAWAAGVTDEWWEPGRTWPIDSSSDWDVKVVVSAYMAKGFVCCDNGSLEAGVEKLAIYCDEDGEPTHVARQLSDGHWTSKLGNWEDVEHNLVDFEGAHPAYGSVRVFLERPRQGA